MTRSDLDAHIDDTHSITIEKDPGCKSSTVSIAGEWALSLFNKPCEGADTRGCEEVGGRMANVFLADCRGTWYDEDGREVVGYLYFKPE